MLVREVPTCLAAKNQNIKQKRYHKKSSIKTKKMVYMKKKNIEKNTQLDVLIKEKGKGKLG